MFVKENPDRKKKKETLTSLFSCEFCEFLRTLFYRTFLDNWFYTFPFNIAQSNRIDYHNNHYYATKLIFCSCYYQRKQTFVIAFPLKRSTNMAYFIQQTRARTWTSEKSAPWTFRKSGPNAKIYCIGSNSFFINLRLLVWYMIIPFSNSGRKVHKSGNFDPNFTDFCFCAKLRVLKYSRVVVSNFDPNKTFLVLSFKIFCFG